LAGGGDAMGRTFGTENQNATRTIEITTEDILRLDDELQLKIVILRHMKKMKWEDISNATNYCIRHLHRLHKKAMDKIGGD
jgi:hypothetical protein